MHKYLRAIGFSNITKDEFKEICNQIINNSIVGKTAIDSEGNEFFEISEKYGEFFGLTIRGICKDNGSLEIEYYYPYFYGNTVSTMEEVDIEKHAEKESYAGICDELRLGVSLIFYLQNVVDYLTAKTGIVYQKPAEGVILGALSTEGKILLPICKKRQELSDIKKKENRDRNYLIAAAREGDEEAIESLTLEDIDIYSMLSRRIAHEDVLSIVSSYVLPCGIESDQYSVMGEIMDFHLEQNTLTGEKIYTMDLLCNDMPFSVCINQKDLLGEPQVGRRFRGNIWMQGRICYEK